MSAAHRGEEAQNLFPGDCKGAQPLAKHDFVPQSRCLRGYNHNSKEILAKGGTAL